AARGLLLEPVGARPGRVGRGPGSHPGDAGAIARGARTGARPHLRGGRADPGSPRRGDQPGLARVAGPPARAAGRGGVAGGAVARTGCGLTAPRPRNIRAEGRDFPWRPSEFRGMEELLRKYDRPGPRYTSYPTVPAWTDSFGPDDYAEKLREAAALGREAPLSLYVHIPFCREMCTYCGCNVVVSTSREKHEEYVEVLRRELDLLADHLGSRNRLSQIHYGGGTPTSLSEDHLVRLWEKIRERFEITPDAEVAVEIDPVVTRREQLALLRGMGFNRLSLGVQDFTPEVQRAVNRIQTVEETESMVEYARHLGFRGINFDLIYGLPHQRVETFEKTIDEVLRIAPDRLAIFSYAHVPDARPNQRRIDPATLPLGPEKYAIFDMARRKLLSAGYVAIGMDHFARHDDELAVAQRE